MSVLTSSSVTGSIPYSPPSHSSLDKCGSIINANDATVIAVVTDKMQYNSILDDELTLFELDDSCCDNNTWRQ